MKRSFPWEDQVDVSGSELDSSSPNSNSNGLLANPTIQFPLPNPSTEALFPPTNCSHKLFATTKIGTVEGLHSSPSPNLLSPQCEVKGIRIPSSRGSVIPFTSWMGLGRSIKALYGQPLHYLTNILLKQWDQLRIGSEDEYKPLDDIVHPCKAEATVWLMEEIHRQTSSHFHIANLWKDDPMYNGFVDSIFPTIENTS